MDGHMKGMNEDSKTLLPCWKYGHFSMLIDTDTVGKAIPVYVSHDKKRYTLIEVRIWLMCMRSRQGIAQLRLVFSYLLKRRYAAPEPMIEVFP
jgi:hypothetical protein